MIHRRSLVAAALLLIAATPGDRFVAFNATSATPLTGLALAPAGTQKWGPNLVLTDPDKLLDVGERLKLPGVKHGRYDARLGFGKDKTCIKRDIDLTRDTSFEIRDADLAAC